MSQSPLHKVGQPTSTSSHTHTSLSHTSFSMLGVLLSIYFDNACGEGGRALMLAGTHDASILTHGLSLPPLVFPVVYYVSYAPKAKPGSRVPSHTSIRIAPLHTLRLYLSSARLTSVSPILRFLSPTPSSKKIYRLARPKILT